MSFILDTNIISELRKPSPAIELLNWFEQVSEDSLFISVLTLGEIQNGISRLKNGRKKKDLIIWFETLKESYKQQLLPVTDNIAIKWGGLNSAAQKAGRPLPIIEGLIAATAAVTGSILVTRNTEDFKETGIMLMNPWEN